MQRHQRCLRRLSLLWEMPYTARAWSYALLLPHHRRQCFFLQEIGERKSWRCPLGLSVLSRGFPRCWGLPGHADKLQQQWTLCCFVVSANLGTAKCLAKEVEKYNQDSLWCLNFPWTSYSLTQHGNSVPRAPWFTAGEGRDLFCLLWVRAFCVVLIHPNKEDKHLVNPL